MKVQYRLQGLYSHIRECCKPRSKRNRGRRGRQRVDGCHLAVKDFTERLDTSRCMSLFELRFKVLKFIIFRELEGGSRTAAVS
jgi:hypothetical protein